MIPYDDLVVALATWRARQGLPVAQLSGALTPPPAPPVPVPRSNPPAPPRGGFVANVVTPPPLAPAPGTHDEAMDVDESALIDEAHYENEGDDFAMAFPAGTAAAAAAAAPDADESTAIGSAPGVARDSFGGSTEPEPPKGKHNRNDDW
jgi:hypothetical protein